jgi:ParB-like chromosome segregation protein Spo0J
LIRWINYLTFGLGKFIKEILIIAIPIIPLRTKRSIDETPGDDIATRITTVERIKPVFLAKFPKSV